MKNWLVSVELRTSTEADSFVYVSESLVLAALSVRVLRESKVELLLREGWWYLLTLFLTSLLSPLGGKLAVVPRFEVKTCSPNVFVLTLPLNALVLCELARLEPVEVFGLSGSEERISFMRAKASSILLAFSSSLCRKKLMVFYGHVEMCRYWNSERSHHWEFKLKVYFHFKSI